MNDTRNAKENETKSRVARHGNTETVHNPEPDYHRPLLEIPPDARKRMLDRFAFLYGADAAEEWLPELERILKVYYAHKPKRLIEREKNLVLRGLSTKGDI